MPECEEKSLTHVDETGCVRMVDVSSKEETERVAVARGRVYMLPETLRLILAGQVKKGDVLTTARIAGIMAAKQTWTLIPMCHPLMLTHVQVELTPGPAEADPAYIDIEAAARTTGRTGVEMEALTAVSVAALTIYDMAKAVDRGMRISDIRLVRKAGGKSGEFILEE